MAGFILRGKGAFSLAEKGVVSVGCEGRRLFMLLMETMSHTRIFGQKIGWILVFLAFSGSAFSSATAQNEYVVLSVDSVNVNSILVAENAFFGMVCMENLETTAFSNMRIIRRTVGLTDIIKVAEKAIENDEKNSFGFDMSIGIDCASVRGCTRLLRYKKV